MQIVHGGAMHIAYVGAMQVFVCDWRTCLGGARASVAAICIHVNRQILYGAPLAPTASDVNIHALNTHVR